MNETEFAFWMGVVMLVNTPPYAAASYLFIRWRRMAIRGWVRNSFLFASLASGGFVAMRLFAFFFVENMEMKLLSSAYFVTGSYLIIAMFAIATRVTERRFAENERKLRDAMMDTQKTSDVLGAVIAELRELDKYRTART